MLPIRFFYRFCLFVRLFIRAWGYNGAANDYQSRATFLSIAQGRRANERTLEKELGPIVCHFPLRCRPSAVVTSHIQARQKMPRVELLRYTKN